MDDNNEDALSSLSSIEEKDETSNSNYELINNGYTCDKCSSIPEITNIDFINDTIKINCPNEHANELSWKNFINESLNQNYYFAVCNICNKNIQKNNEHIFKFCYNFNKIICENCYLNHEKTHNIINNNEYYNKCPKHYNQIYTSFCSDCKENICDECKRSKMHRGHRKYDFLEIEPTNDEIAQINDFCSKFKNSLKSIENSGKKEIEELKNIKNQLLEAIRQASKSQNQNLKDEYNKNINNNIKNYEIKKQILVNKYNEDLRKLFEEFESLNKNYKKNLLESLSICQQNYNEAKNKVESNYESLIIKCQKYKNELKVKYNNIIKLNEIIINSYNKNKNQYYYIINVANDLKFIKDYNNNLMPNIFLKTINDKYNLDIKEDNIEIIKKIISNEGVKTIISEINRDKLLNIYISASHINQLSFLGNYSFNQLQSLSVINCNVKNIDNLKNIISPQLLRLDLSNNNIEDISAFKDCKIGTLEYLNLSNNYISNLNVFENKVFSNLKELNLSYNKIVDIIKLNNANLSKIITIILSYNLIKDTNIFKWNYLKNLQNLYIDNQCNTRSISNIS